MSNGFRDFRERIGVKTQTELAKTLGIKPSNVSEWEAGTGYPSYITMKKLFEMGATVEELFGIPYDPSETIAIGPNMLKRIIRIEKDMNEKFQYYESITGIKHHKSTPEKSENFYTEESNEAKQKNMEFLEKALAGKKEREKQELYVKSLEEKIETLEKRLVALESEKKKSVAVG